MSFVVQKRTRYQYEGTTSTPLSLWATFHLNILRYPQNFQGITYPSRISFKWNYRKCCELKHLGRATRSWRYNYTLCNHGWSQPMLQFMFLFGISPMDIGYAIFHVIFFQSIPSTREILCSQLYYLLYNYFVRVKLVSFSSSYNLVG